MDIIRNISVRESCVINNVPVGLINQQPDVRQHRYSLPNINFHHELTGTTATAAATGTVDVSNSTQQQHQSPPPPPSLQQQTDVDLYGDLIPNQSTNSLYDRQMSMLRNMENECAISGRLEIRVVPQEQSPNPEESIYFDAITNGTMVNIRSDIIETKEPIDHHQHHHHRTKYQATVNLQSTSNNKIHSQINDANTQPSGGGSVLTEPQSKTEDDHKDAANNDQNDDADNGIPHAKILGIIVKSSTIERDDDSNVNF